LRETDELVTIFGGVRSTSTSQQSAEPSVASVTTKTTTTSVVEDGTETPVAEPEAPTTTATEVESDQEPIAVESVAGPIVPGRKLDLLQLGVDRRMILNRKRQLKMMRVWLQVRSNFRLSSSSEE
jgi:tRNAThr (cytosine32-N3)-methyltransferase